MTGNPPPELSDRAASLMRILGSLSRRRVQIDEIWHAFDRADPATRTFLHRRKLLADTLDELAAGHAIELPARHSYDRTEQPPLPRFITLPGSPRSAPAAPRIIWHPTLAWAAEADLVASHRLALDAINKWLFTNTDEFVVPLRERSLEVLGDEKAFDRLQTTSLFGPDRLTLELLRARRVAPPMHTVRIGDGPILLVIENSDTFDSLRHTLARNPGKVGLVGWGAGAAFEASIVSIKTISADVREIAYFGDLDARGLQIPAHADRLAAALGLPRVHPAVGLYSALRDTGRRQEGQARLSADAVITLVAWLDPQHRSWASELIRAGRRLAQESVGLAHLTRHNEWRIGLD